MFIKKSVLGIQKSTNHEKKKLINSGKMVNVGEYVVVF